MGAVLPSAVLTNRAVGLPALRLPGGPLVRPRYLLRHTFSGASLTPSDQGPNLTTDNGTPSVSGGVLSKSDTNQLRLVAAGIGANLVVQARVDFGNSAGTDRRFQFQARFESAGNYVQVLLSRTNNELTIQRGDAFSNTTILTAGSLGLADSTNYWLRFACSGSRLEAWTSTDGATFTSRGAVTEPLYVMNRDLRMLLTDNVASPTIQVDDLLIWRAP